MARSYLHCSGCQVDHPTFLFSKQQRESPISSRNCIGHEGHIRLCTHRIVTWAEVQSAANSGKMQTLHAKGGAMTLQRCTSMTCAVDCNDLAGRLLSRARKAIRTPSCCPALPICGIGAHRRIEGIRSIIVTLRWSAHLSTTMTPHSCFKFQELARGLAMLRERGGRLICPQLRPGQHIGAGLFDPNYCDCLDYESLELTAWDRPLPENLPLTEGNCRQNSSRRFGGDKGEQTANVCSDGFTHTYRGCSTDFKEYNSGALEPAKGTNRHYQSVEAVKCPNKRNCVKISHESSITLTLEDSGLLQQMSRSWYQALDPLSYNLISDADGFGVYWCRDERCRNYYRYNQSRLKPLLRDFRHDCPL